MTSRHCLFAYGTLLVPEVFERVVGRAIESRAALLRGYVRHSLRALPYPAIVARQGSEVAGAVYAGVDEDELRRLDAYEGELYDRRGVELCVGDERVSGYAYVLCDAHQGALSTPEWDLEQFRREHLASYLARIGRA